jgi:hypothetical protein
MSLVSCWQGKFIRINFDVTGYIVGANIETCILLAKLGHVGPAPPLPPLYSGAEVAQERHIQPIFPHSLEFLPEQSSLGLFSFYS